MASIRRTLSPVPRPGALINGEAISVASPLSKSSSCSTQIPSASGGLISSLFGSFDSPRSSRPLERSKPKGQVWKRALFHFLVCFVVGVFVGLTPFVSMTLSTNPMSKQQTFNFGMVSSVEDIQRDGEGSMRNVTSSTNGGSVNNTSSFESKIKEQGLPEVISDDEKITNQSFPQISDDDKITNQSFSQDSDLMSRKLLIVVTPTYARPLQAYYLKRMADTLRSVQPPLLWIVVDMMSQSDETAEILRRTEVMYRHLVCRRNLTDIKDRKVHQRNVALFHIENHRLDGIVSFADDDNVFSAELFEQMRQIRRFGTWPVAKITGTNFQASLEGPVCNGTQVIGWHINEPSKKLQRFHADMSGFAFNSTVLWDPKQWHRPTLEPVRQLDTARDGFQASTFIQQIVEDESQMEGLVDGCSRIMVWVLPLESSNSFYPQKWFLKSNLDAIVQFA